jgi:alpha-ribazole phosphatase
MEVYLIRHTTPAIEKGICYGQTDVPLANSFPSEAQKVLSMLPTEIEKIYTSPLERCRDLANYLGLAMGVPIKTDYRLMELDFGDWELKKWNQINEEDLNKWMANFETVPCPNGESYTDLLHRINDFLESLYATSASRVAIVTHGGVIKTIRGKSRQEDLKDTLSLQVDYGEIWKYRL